MIRATKMMVLGGLTAAALIDGSAAVVGAEGEENAEAPAPAAAPAWAMLTGDSMVDQVDLDGVSVRAARVHDSWELTFHNGTAAARALDLAVHCSESSMIPMGRMGPMTVEHEVERIELVLASGATARHRIHIKPPAPPEGVQAQNAIARVPRVQPSFAAGSTWSFTFRPTSAPLTAEHLASSTLRVAHTPS